MQRHGTESEYSENSRKSCVCPMEFADDGQRTGTEAEDRERNSKRVVFVEWDLQKGKEMGQNETTEIPRKSRVCPMEECGDSLSQQDSLCQIQLRRVELVTALFCLQINPSLQGFDRI